MQAINFRTFLGNIVKTYDDVTGNKPSLLRVSTITVMGGRQGSTPLNTFTEKFVDGDHGWKLGTTHFNNSLTISKQVGNGKNRSVKIFPNGKIHVTGSSTPLEGLDIIQEIQSIVDKIFPEIKDNPIIPMETQMINATFQVPHGIDQMTLLDLLKTQRKYVSKISFNPETYAAVKCKMFGMSVSIFKTGSVVLAGANNFKDLAVAYRFLLKILYSKDVITQPMNIKEREPMWVYQKKKFIQNIRDFYLLNK
jgi:TATA-box binding protein (TBP) (component of TFIID and TFIIIB)